MPFRENRVLCVVALLLVVALLVVVLLASFCRRRLRVYQPFVVGDVGQEFPASEVSKEVS